MNAKAGEYRHSELRGLMTSQSLCATIGPLQDNWSLFHYVIRISGMLPYNRNITLQTLELFSAFARLYNAAALPASRLRLAGSLAVIWKYLNLICHFWVSFASVSKQFFVQLIPLIWKCVLPTSSLSHTLNSLLFKRRHNVTTFLYSLKVPNWEILTTTTTTILFTP